MDIVESIVTFWGNVTVVWGVVPVIGGLTWKTGAHLVCALVVLKLVDDNV